MQRLEGKVAIITGAGGGIGAAIARAFTAEGAAVQCLDVDTGAAGGARLGARRFRRPRERRALRRARFRIGAGRGGGGGSGVRPA